MNKAKPSFIIFGVWWFMKDQIQTMDIIKLFFKLRQTNGLSLMTEKFNTSPMRKLIHTVKKDKYVAYSTKDHHSSAQIKKSQFQAAWKTKSKRFKRKSYWRLIRPEFYRIFTNWASLQVILWNNRLETINKTSGAIFSNLFFIVCKRSTLLLNARAF